MSCPPEVLELINRFAAYRSKYTSVDYNETQLRNEFLNPFFEILGWDIYNKAGISELYKDVIHEDQVKIGGMSKAPDYSFRIGGSRKFFVEAEIMAEYIVILIESWYNKGLAISNLGRYQEKLDAYNKALEIAQCERRAES